MAVLLQTKNLPAAPTGLALAQVLRADSAAAESEINRIDSVQVGLQVAVGAIVAASNGVPGGQTVINQLAASLDARYLTTTPIADWNLAVTNGNFVSAASATSNAPDTVNSWSGTVHVDATGNNVTQTVYAYGVDTSANTQTFRRDMNAGVWTAWYKLQPSQLEQDARYLTTTPIADWNLAVTNGNFVSAASATSNAPDTVNSWSGTVHVDATGNNVTQTVYAYGVDTAANTQTFRRDMNAGVWTGWVKLQPSQLEQDNRYVKQGGGVGQLTNPVKTGWDGARLRTTVDMTDLGAHVMQGTFATDHFNQCPEIWVVATVARSLPNTAWGEIAMNTINSNSGAFTVDAGGGVVVPKTGYYRIRGYTTLGSGSSAVHTGIAVGFNRAVAHFGVATTTAAGGYWAHGVVESVAYLTAGTVISLYGLVYGLGGTSAWGQINAPGGCQMHIQQIG